MDTLTVQVWKQDFTEFKSPAAKLVALALARRGRESGACWARQATLADDCGVSKQTVGRCLDELEAVGWLKREARLRSDGGRTSDIIWLCLPAVTLNCSSVDQKEAEGMARLVEAEAATVDSRVTNMMGGALSGMGGAPITESTLKESLKDSTKKDSSAGSGEPTREELKIAVDMIWAKASKIGRQRSSKGDIEAGLSAALKRGHQMGRILTGMRGYFESQDATKDDGAYQRGAHLLLAKDRWESYLDDEKARAAAHETPTPAALQAQQDVGTVEAPSESRQRLWMQLWKEGMAWGPERGPMPGRLGCRVDPAIQREFGAEPYTDQPGDDSAAFD